MVMRFEFSLSGCSRSEVKILLNIETYGPLFKPRSVLAGMISVSKSLSAVGIKASNNLFSLF